MLLALLTLAMDLRRPTIPLHFEPNRGQVAGETEWIAKANGGTLFITSTAVAFATQDPGKRPRIMRFVGARTVKGEGLDPTGAYSNYFDGRDEKDWRSGIPHFGKVRYKGLYEGIDLVYYSTPDRRIEYDLEVHAGADLNQVVLSFAGFDGIEIDSHGDLVLRLGEHSIKQHRPKVVQSGKEIACAYLLLAGNRVRLEVAHHDESLPITVDPTLDFSTYLGGPGQDSLNSVVVDLEGNIYVAGYSETPASPSLNPFQQTNTVVGAAYVAKFTPNADAILYYSTLRSTGGYSQAYGIGVDSSGSPTLVGTTDSTNFPLKHAFQSTITADLYTGFVSRFAADGRTIVYSSYYGGSGTDTLLYGVLDSSGAMIFMGNTSSKDLPVKNAFQSTYGGGNADCFMAKVDATGSLVFSTYFGGSGTDYCYQALAVDNADRIYLGGQSYSDDLPLVNPIQTTRSPRSGFPTAFLARFAPDGSSLDYSSFLGGLGSGGVDSVAIDAQGFIYLGGSAFGGQFGTVNAYQSTCISQICGLLMKLDPTGQQVMNSTFFAGSGWSGVQSIAIGSDNSLYVTGSANSADFPTLNSLFPFVGGGSFNQDLFVAKFLGDLRTLVYSTFVGGDRDDYPAGLAVDSLNRAYVVGWTTSDNFPVENAFQTVYGGGGGVGDGFLFRISDSSVVTASPLIANPGQVQFRYVQGGPAIPNQTVQLTGVALPFTVSSNAAWLTVTPQAGTAPATLSIGAVQLAPGNYTGTVTVTPASGTPLNIAVNYSVLYPAPRLTSVSPALVPLYSDATTVTFAGSGFTPQTQLLIGSVTWSGAPVVYIDPQTLRTTMPYQSFIAVGTYQFAAVNPQSDVSSAVTVSVGGVTPVITSVVNAASQLSGPLAPGELIQVSGSGVGTSPQLTVTIGGIAATPLSSSNTQIFVVVPNQLNAGIEGETADVVLSTGGFMSVPTTLPLVPASPGLFTADGSGKGPALIQGDATPNSTITLFGTGGGDLTLPFTMTLNGVNVPIGMVGAVAGKPGWFQITATVPANIPNLISKRGPARPTPPELVVSVGGRSSQAGVTLLVKVVE